MDLGDQRTSSVENREAEAQRLILDRTGYAMSAEYRERAWRHVRQAFDKAGALGFQAFDHRPVVYNLVAHIDRGAVFIERTFDNIDGADHAGAKTARLSQDHFH